MYPAPFQYHRAETLQEALALLSKFGDEAKVIAGGQTLLPMLKMRLGDTSHIIDIGRLANLSYIEQRGDTVHIGALATHAEIAASEVAQRIPLLKDCGGGIADRQVRNRGTIGGGLSVADPSGDWPTGLRVLDAVVVCTGPNGSRDVAIKDFVVDSYTSCLKDNELVTEVKIKVPPANSGGAYVAFKRAAPAYPTSTVAVQLTLKDDQCEDIRMALGASGAKPVVCEAAEASLRGQALTRDAIEKAAELIVAESSPPADARGSEAFKRAMLRSLLVESVERAQARARGEQIKGEHRYA